MPATSTTDLTACQSSIRLPESRELDSMSVGIFHALLLKKRILVVGLSPLCKFLVAIDDGRTGHDASGCSSEGEPKIWTQSITSVEMWANPKGQVERAAKVPESKLPWTVRPVRALFKRKLNIAGIFHTLLSEKKDTGGGDKSPCLTSFPCESSMGER